MFPFINERIQLLEEANYTGTEQEKFHKILSIAALLKKYLHPIFEG
jgi:hypothetical protein